MKNSQFKGARVVLVEPKPETLVALRDGLRNHGFSEVVAIGNLGQLEDLVSEDLIDLVICDSEVDNQGFPAFANVIRQGGHGPNPYLATIATTELPTEENVKRVIEAGIDNILVKPLSVQAIIDRITAIVHMRKSFVVSADYIGPDRRLRPRQQVCLPLVQVPNTLKERFNGTYDKERILSEIEKTTQLVNEQRTTQNAVLINEILNQIIPHFQSGEPEDAVLIHLHHLLRSAHDIARRTKTSGDEHVSGLCSALIPVTEKLLSNHLKPEQQDVELLQKLGTAIFMAYGTGEKVEAFSNEISRSIKSAKRFSHIPD